MFVFALPGAVPVVGGYLYPSVPRSLGVSPQKGSLRAAHGPRHPAVNKSLEILLGFCWVVCSVLGFGEGLLFWFLSQCIGSWPFRT